MWISAVVSVVQDLSLFPTRALSKDTHDHISYYETNVKNYQELLMPFWITKRDEKLSSVLEIENIHSQLSNAISITILCRLDRLIISFT